jgi:methyltransferase (TIGR00027 family)
MNNEFYSDSYSSIYKAFSVNPTQEDIRVNRFNRSAEHLTARLKELVPLVDTIGFKLESVTDHETVGGVPLLDSTMNQNGTHQACVFYIMSDYLAGTMVYAALAGTYAIGLHDRSTQQPVQLWLNSNSVKHIRPGTGYIRGKATLTDDEIKRTREKLANKGRCEVQMHVDIFQDDELVATAEPLIGVYINNPRIPNTKIDFFQRENHSLSAKLIAGLRTDKSSQEVAGEQGRALARRFSLATPQLPKLIEARGRHLDDHIKNMGHNYKQIMILGLGLDTRPDRFSGSGHKWFGLDLRHMIKNRRETFTNLGLNHEPLTHVATDLRFPGWSSAILKEGFNADLPTLFILEGISMYLTIDELKALLNELSNLNQSPDSCIWVDHVTPELYSLPLAEVKSFLKMISRLGEPFISGFRKVEDFSSGWKTIHQCSSDEILNLPMEMDVIYENHFSSLLKPQ